MPSSRSLQHSDRLRHVESTVLLIKYVCMLFLKMCSATSLSVEWFVEGKKRMRSGRKGITSLRVGFFLALMIFFRESNWLKWHQSFTARSFLPNCMSFQRLIRRRRFYSYFPHTRKCVAKDRSFGLVQALSNDEVTLAGISRQTFEVAESRMNEDFSFMTHMLYCRIERLKLK